jgi:hypothetical protein
MRVITSLMARATSSSTGANAAPACAEGHR